MPFENEHSARMIDPEKFIKESFRSVQIARGIRIIIWKLKGSDKTITQTYRFDKSIFTAQEAKDWMKAHNKDYISFEASKQ